MKLKVYNRQNSGNFQQRDPQITFAESGSIRINRTAIEKMGISVNQEVDFLFDVDDKQWYFSPRSKGNGFIIRSASKGDKSVTFNSASVCKKVFKDFKSTESGASVRAMVGDAIDAGGFGQVFVLLMHPKPGNQSRQ